MPRPKRAEQFPPNEVAVAHCIQRCVRRAYLAGVDAGSQKSFEHRREWIRRRMELLASIFGLDVLSYAVLSNHIHVMLRTRPDVVKTWSDEDVASRWLRLFPGKRLEEYLGNPTQADIAKVLGDAKRLALLRTRLSDISWFMRALCEPIARQANQEDKCTGRFWEGRFKAQKIVDEAGLLACAMYVDLNPVRAALAATPEKSKFTSAYDRIAASQGTKGFAAAFEFEAPPENANHLAKASDSRRKRGEPEGVKYSASKKLPVDSWLCPLEIEERKAPGPMPSHLKTRASDKGFLPMKQEEYLTLLDWTGRQGREGKRGSIPADLQPILERIGIDGSMWCDFVWKYSKYFGKAQAAGRPESMKAEASKQGRIWLKGQKSTQALFLS